MNERNKTLRDILARFRGSPNFQNQGTAVFLRRLWPDMVGPILADHSQIRKVEGATVFIVVDHPLHHQELQSRVDSLRSTISSLTGLNDIRLVFKIGVLVFHNNLPAQSDDDGIKKLEEKYQKYYDDIRSRYEKPTPGPEQNQSPLEQKAKDVMERLHEILFESETDGHGKRPNES